MAEIKILELSVGDWVMNLYAKKPSRVIGLRTMFQDTYEIIAVSDDTQYMLIEDNKELHNYEPIPLTPEILEKNGFVYSKVTRWYNCELKDTQRTRIGVHFGLIGADRIELSSVDAFNEDWSTIDVMINKPIKGVHQLQHALRLAGVGKEIEV